MDRKRPDQGWRAAAFAAALFAITLNFLQPLAHAAMLRGGGTQAAGLQAFERGSWAKLRTAHDGKPVVVHLWALTCAPCLVEMPLWGRLAAERPDMRLVMIAADPVPQDPSRVSDMIARSGLAKAENWVFADRFNERLRYEIDPAWGGELPRTMMIDRDGQVTMLPGVADLAEVRTWLDKEGNR